MRPVTCRSGMSRRPTTVVKTEPPEDDDVKPPTPALSPQAQSFDLDRSFLSCAVCLEILHNPVNVNPCNHKFCGRCIFQWLDRNEACPKCRNKVEDVTEDGFAADICKEFLRSYPDHCRSQEVEKDVDKNELEYLEKLEDRLNNPRRVFEWEIMDPDLRVRPLDPATYSRKLRLVPSRFRDQQWKERIRRLRQQLQLPPRAVAPPPGRPIPETNGRIIPNLPRNSDQNRYNGVLPVTVNRRLSYPNRGRIASPPRNLTRAERYQRRERRSQRAEREDSPIHGIPAPFSPLPIGFNDLLRMAYDEEDFDSDDGLPFF